MGLIKAASGSIGGSFADQWLEAVEADNMTNRTLITGGVSVRPNDTRSSNKKGTVKTITNGSVVHVYPNQMMILTDGGKIVDYTAEEGYFRIENSAAPSLFNGQLKDTVKDTFNRFKFGGTPSTAQKVYFINLQEIRGIKFGTKNPINYYDNFYDAELFVRAFGEYSIKITDPLKFFNEVADRSSERVEINNVNSQYLSEFMNALQSSINKMSADGIRVSMLTSKGLELANYLSNALDATWNELRGIEIAAVGIDSISYDEESKNLINMRNKGAMLKDATIREGFVQGAIASGLEAAGSNTAGAAQAFMGMGIGMGQTGNFMGAASQTNMSQMQMQKAQKQENQENQKQENQVKSDEWKCECGASNTGKFCSQCGQQKKSASDAWICSSCGANNSGKFCSECGTAAPSDLPWKCECGQDNTGKFCSNCGKKRP